MRIIVAEMYYPISHKQLNRNLIKCLLKIGDLTIVDDGEYFDLSELPQHRIKRIHVKPILLKRNERLKHITHLYNLYQLSKAIKDEDYDLILFLSVHTVSFSLGLHFFRKDKPIYVMHHYDLDRMMNSKIERFLFSKTMRKYKHIVLADFIKDGLAKSFNLEDNVFVVNQPPKHDSIDPVVCVAGDSKTILALSRNNDEGFIKNLIEESKKMKSLKNKIIIRSKIEYNSPVLSAFNKYLTPEEYEKTMNSSNVLLIIYPKHYNLRYSGVFDDALFNGRIVICNDIPIGRYYHKLYPNNCLVIKDEKELLCLADSMDFKLNLKEYTRFIDERTKENTIKQFVNAFKS